MLMSRCIACDSRPTFDRDAVSRRADPTGCTPIRMRWQREVRRRWGRIKKIIRRAVVDLDVLGLGQSTTDSAIIIGVLGRMAPTVVRDDVRVLNKYEFSRNPAKVSAFMGYLQQEVDAGVLAVTPGTVKVTAAEDSWQNVYIDSAYQKGIRDAYATIDQPGSIAAAFNQPVHADAAGIIYTRSFEALSNVTEATAQAIREELTLALIEGVGPMEMARRLAEEVDSIGITRAELIARTETTATYAEATLNSYEEAGLEGVTVMAEFATAQDEQVCPDCEELEGKEYDLEEARGLIPVHPNCRCAFLPVVSSEGT